jgi:hypothetical protein
METTEKNYKECFLEVITRFKQEFTSSDREEMCKLNYIETFRALGDDEEAKNVTIDLILGMPNERVIQIFVEEIPAKELGFGLMAMEWIHNLPGISFEFLGLSNPMNEVELRVLALFSIYIVREGYIYFTGDQTMKKKNREYLSLILK